MEQDLFKLRRIKLLDTDFNTFVLSLTIFSIIFQSKSWPFYIILEQNPIL